MSNEKNSGLKLPEEFIDALQEVGNIGSGHAANALADILNRKIDMSLPKFNLVTLDELSTLNWSDQNPLDPYVFIMVETTGTFKFIVLVVFDKKTLKEILKLVSSSEEVENEFDLVNLSNFSKSTIKEIGNILALHYLTAIGEFLDVKFNDENSNIAINYPELLIENSETVLTSIASHIESDFINIINIECEIFTSDTILNPHIVLIPEEDTVQKSLDKLFGT